MMNKKALGETALISYNSAVALSEVIERAVNKKSILTASRELDGNLIRMFEHICTLLERKAYLKVFAACVEETVCSIDETQAKIVVLRFFDRLSHEQIYAALNMPRRTYFRKLEQAVEAVGKEMFSRHFSEKLCVRLFESEHWLKKLYESCLKKPGIEGRRIISLTKESERLMYS